MDVFINTLTDCVFIYLKDIVILEFIKLELNYNGDIKSHNNMISLTIYSKQIKEDLIKLGITPLKTGKKFFVIFLKNTFIHILEVFLTETVQLAHSNV